MLLKDRDCCQLISSRNLKERPKKKKKERKKDHTRGGQGKRGLLSSPQVALAQHPRPQLAWSVLLPVSHALIPKGASLSCGNSGHTEARETSHGHVLWPRGEQRTSWLWPPLGPCWLVPAMIGSAERPRPCDAMTEPGQQEVQGTSHSHLASWHCSRQMWLPTKHTAVEINRI